MIPGPLISYGIEIIEDQTRMYDLTGGGGAAS